MATKRGVPRLARSYRVQYNEDMKRKNPAYVAYNPPARGLPFLAVILATDDTVAARAVRSQFTEIGHIKNDSVRHHAFVPGYPLRARWHQGCRQSVADTVPQRALALGECRGTGCLGTAPSRLELEITETVLLANSQATLAVLQQIHMLGVHIAMDDFGTGYSSLSYLRSFPFDKIKIDQSFVKDAGDVDSSIAIIRAVTSLGNSLGMQTTAEGVETAGQLERVRREGCTEAQGFLLSRPLPARDIPAMLERTRAVVAGDIIEPAPEVTGERNREQVPLVDVAAVA